MRLACTAFVTLLIAGTALADTDTVTAGATSPGSITVETIATIMLALLLVLGLARRGRIG